MSSWITMVDKLCVVVFGLKWGKGWREIWYASVTYSIQWINNSKCLAIVLQGNVHEDAHLNIVFKKYVNSRYFDLTSSTTPPAFPWEPQFDSREPSASVIYAHHKDRLPGLDIFKHLRFNSSIHDMIWSCFSHDPLLCRVKYCVAAHSHCTELERGGGCGVPPSLRRSVGKGKGREASPEDPPWVCQHAPGRRHTQEQVASTRRALFCVCVKFGVYFCFDFHYYYY